MKILIIGSKGFIGTQAFLHFSLNENYEVYGADVIVDYNSENYFLLDSSNGDFNEIFQQCKFDVCINCSGAASVPDSLVHSLRDFSLNTFNVLKILEAIKKQSADCKFINLSSAAVYGNPVNSPIKETNELQPVSPYGFHKLYAEQIMQEYVRFYNMKCASLRIFSAYGKGQKKQLLWDIYQKSVHSDHVILFGTGNETRDFINIKDIVRVIELIMLKGDFQAGIYNVANGKGVSIKELAQEMLSQLNYSGKLSFSGNERKWDPVNWEADVQKIKHIGYYPEVELKKGIEIYIQWLKENL